MKLVGNVEDIWNFLFTYTDHVKYLPIASKPITIRALYDCAKRYNLTIKEGEEKEYTDDVLYGWTAKDFESFVKVTLHENSKRTIGENRTEYYSKDDNAFVWVTELNLPCAKSLTYNLSIQLINPSGTDVAKYSKPILSWEIKEGVLILVHLDSVDYINMQNVAYVTEHTNLMGV